MKKKRSKRRYNTILCVVIGLMVIINANLLIHIGDIHFEGIRADKFRFAYLRSLSTSFIGNTADNVKSDASSFIKKGIEFFNDHIYRGPVLSKGRGTIQGPSGKETYYNLNMAGVVSIMRRQGYDYEYWVREDGVKMFGKYVMVAANLNLRPRGSLIQTSLGMGIVCDTGGFAARNPTQIDIATAW
jgi:hypothetical protein